MQHSLVFSFLLILTFAVSILYPKTSFEEECGKEKKGESEVLQPCLYPVSFERCRIRPKDSSSANVSWPCSTNKDS